MRCIQLAGTGLNVSRFSFGTASLHHVGSGNVQVEHLRAAAALGFSHFDTAPLYGFGAAETALGSLGSTNFTVATKVGLYPPGGSSQSRLEMSTRKAIGQIFPAISRANADWCVKRASRSLEGSLRRLRRERVDLLFLHEPDGELLATDEWLRWLELEVTMGRVGFFGISGTAARIQSALAASDQLGRVLQTRDSVIGREADFMSGLGIRPQITYGYLSAAGEMEDPLALLRDALARNPDGSILVSTRNSKRLATFAAAAEAETIYGGEN